MKIYALRDRLIDYYLQPFIAPTEKQMLASLAQLVNGEENHAVAKAPHHFEAWELAEIDEEGNVTPTRRLVADASSLLRAGIRETTERNSTEPARQIRSYGGSA